MVALPQTFNTADLPDSGGKIAHIPDGTYKAVIVESDLKDTSSGAGKMLVLKLVITDGSFANTELTERLNIINPNQTAVEIAFRTLARISEAVGMTQTPSDSNQLHNKPLLIKLKTEKGKPWKDKDGVEREGSDRSVIEKYIALGSGVAATATAAPAAGSSATTPAAGKLPWQK